MSLKKRQNRFVGVTQSLDHNMTKLRDGRIETVFTDTLPYTQPHLQSRLKVYRVYWAEKVEESPSGREVQFLTATKIASMKAIFKTHRRVEFSDTDMAGIAHFSNFFRYMEEAEHEFLRHVGQNVVLYDERGTLGFPKLEAHCEYKHPAVHDAEMCIEMKIDCENGKSIRYDFEISQQLDDAEGSGSQRLLAKGHLCVACCRFPPDGLPFPIPIPENVMDAIRKVAPENVE